VAPRLRVRQGDITTFEGDAIVNAANESLQLRVGVAGAILQAGGPEIQDGCNRHGPIRVGDAAITPGGKLRVRYVIHAAVMSDEAITPEIVRRATESALRIAAEHGVARLAMPILGTGVGRIAVADAAGIMLDVIRTSPYADNIEVIVLFGYRNEDAEILEALVG
jgi:O-acetyl-ADP-ribose deacetylase (regulator of RNase III)